MSKITTYTRKRMDPCHPEMKDIDIEDIAHALSMMTRAGGQFDTFYSVGQHCIACATEAEARGYSKDVQLFCLLHDASEAYLADITRPVKAQLPDYLIYEKRLQDIIYNKFLGRLPDEEEQEKIDSIDNSMLYFEFLEIMKREIREGDFEINIKLDTAFRGFDYTEKEYLSLFCSLYCL